MITIIVIAFLALLAFVMFRKYYLKHWSDNLDVKISILQQELVEGETGQLEEVVTNGKRMAIPMLKVAFKTDRELEFEKRNGSKTTDMYYHNDVFGLKGGERITRTYSFVPSGFGYFRIDSKEIIAFDIFFTVKEMMELKEDEVLYVYPRPFYSEKFAFYLRQLNGEIITNSISVEDPFEFRGIREYQPYDDMRTINWKATAKTGELKVTQKHPTSTKEMRIVLNLEDIGIRRKEEQIKDCVRVAAGLAGHFVKMGMKTALYTNAKDVFTGAPASIQANIGTGHLREVCRQLARLNLKEEIVPATTCFQDLIFCAGENMTCFVSCNAYPEFLEMLEHYEAAGNEYVWFYIMKANDLFNVDEKFMKHIKIIKV